MIIPIAHAQTATEGGVGTLGSFVPLILIFVLFYFMLIRPQQKKMKEHRNLIESLAVGDEVVTNSGMMGKIVEMDDTTVVIAFGGSKIQFQRQSVQTILPQGTVKSVQ